MPTRPTSPSVPVHAAARRRAGLVLLCVAWTVIGSGCGRRSPMGAAGAAASGSARASAPASAPVTTAAPGGELVPWRALLDEAARAEVDAGGLLIDLGTVDQHQYTRGGWSTGWGRPQVTAEGTTFAAATTPKPTLHLEAPAGVREVVLRLRSAAPRQVVGVFLGKTHLGDVPAPSAFGVVRVPVAAGTAAGTVAVQLHARVNAAIPVEVDWVWLRTGEAQEPLVAPRVLPVRLDGGVRRALVAAAPRRISFYLEPPAGARLRVDYGASTATRFVIRAVTDDGAHELFAAAAAPGRWQRAEVDLGAVAGRAVRLDLVTDGAAGAAGWGEPEILAPPTRQPPPAAAAPAPRHVILIVSDALRADAVPPVGADPAGLSPAVARLAREGAAFTSAWATANWTRPSFPTILSGLAPATHGVQLLEDVVPEGATLLSERLRAAGFATAAIHGSAVCHPGSGLNRGYDLFRNLSPGDRWTPRTVKPPAGKVLDEALAWLDAQGQRRTFVLVHLMEPHEPYAPPPALLARVHPGPRPEGTVAAAPGALLIPALNDHAPVPAPERRWVRALYQAEVASQDLALARFLTELERRGRLDDTLVVLTGDHGEGMGEHDFFGHNRRLYAEELHVPLILRHPGVVVAGRRHPDVVDHTDVVPTILELLGVPAGAGMDGLSHAALLRGGAAPREASGTAAAESAPAQRTAPLEVPHVAGRVTGPAPGMAAVPPVDGLDLDLRPEAPGFAAGPGAPRAAGLDLDLMPAARGPAPGALPGNQSRAVRTARYTLVVHGAHAPAEVYDRRDDPAELRERAAALPIARRLLAVRLGEALGVPSKQRRAAGGGELRRLKAGKTVLSPALKRQLEALGYLAP